METRIQSIAHLVIALYAFFLFFEGFRRRHAIDRFNHISIINAGIGFWDFFLFLYYGLETPEAVYFVSQWGFVSVILATFGLFFFSWRLSFDRSRDRLLPLFAVVPIVTSLLAVTAPFQGLFLAGHRGFEYMPLRELVIHHGPWFVIHSVSSYFLVAVALVLLVAQGLKPNRKNRAVMLLFVVSVLLFAVFLFLSNFTPLKRAIQPYAFLLHLVFVSVFYWATFLYEDDRVIYFGKYRFYDTIGMPVLMFNSGDELVHYNEEAKRYFAEIEFPLGKYLPYGHLLDGSIFSPIDIGSEGGGDSSVFVQAVRSSHILYFRQRDILDNRDTRIGYSITLYDLRTMDELVKDLERRAYADTLCRCLNRTCFEMRKREILESTSRPLALFVADVDNLKAVNDQYGHKVGDEYLSTCAELLKKVTRTSDALFRIGGDEFVFFLPCPDEASLQRVQKSLAAELSALKREYPCDISIGYSVLGEGDLDFDRHFKIADAAMYRQKKSKKRV